MIFGGHILFSAESEGFEPPVQLPVHRISSAARSTTPASLRSFQRANVQIIFYHPTFRRQKKCIRRIFLPYRRLRFANLTLIYYICIRDYTI